MVCPLSVLQKAPHSALARPPPSPQLRGPSSVLPEQQPPIKALATSMELLTLICLSHVAGISGERGLAFLPLSFRHFGRRAGAPVSHHSWNILIKPGRVSFFQITLRTAGKGRTKSPESTQRMRHVHRKGLEAWEGTTLAGQAGWRL